MSRRHDLLALAALFGRLGSTAFGGPAVHIAMMEDEVVRRRGWMSREEFVDLLGMTNLIPGPNSTEMAIHIGLRRAGFAGLVVAGLSFILPAFAITLFFAWLYVEFGMRADATAILAGIKPAVLAVVAQAMWGLARTALRNRVLLIIAALAIAASLLGAHELLVLLGSGVLCALVRGVNVRKAAAMLAAPLAPVAAATSLSLGALFLFFLKVGSVLFGSGYVLIAFLRGDLVERWHWLTDSQLLDAVAVGQFTPGPVFTTATFVGYMLGRWPGAVLATVGIFLPAFLFVAVSAPLVAPMRRSPAAAAFLDGVNSGAIALMLTVCAALARSALVNVVTMGIAVVSAIALIRFRVNPTWVIVGGAVVGFAIR